MKTKHKQHGFTLLEIIFTILIVSTVMGITSNFIYAGFNQYFLFEEANTHNYEINTVFETITDLLKKACYFNKITKKEIEGFILQKNNHYDPNAKLGISNFTIDFNNKKITLSEKLLIDFSDYETIKLEHDIFGLKNLWKVTIKRKNKLGTISRIRYIYSGNLFSNLQRM